MEVKINDLTDSEKELDVNLTYEEIKPDVDSEVKSRVKNIQMPGFRKGKVPMNIIKKTYGDALEYEASEKVANKWFWKLVEEKELKPIGQPQLVDLDFKPNENFSFKVKYEIIPEIKLKDYTNNDIEIPDFKVTDKEVDQEIDRIVKSNREYEKVEKVGDDNNYVIKTQLQRIDENDEPFEGSKPEVMDIDLSNENVHKDIVEGAKGKKAGETFKFTFTDERNVKNDEGKEEKVSETYHYKGTIQEIKKAKDPELNEEFIKKITKDKVTNEKELREQVEKDIQNYYDQQSEEILTNRLIQTVVEKNDFTPPASLVNNMLASLIEREEENAKRQGIPQLNKEEAEKRYSKAAEMEVKWYLLKEELKKKEEIKVSDEDLKELVKQDAVKTGLPEDKLMNYYKSSNYDEKLLDKKLLDFLKEQNNIKRVNPEKLAKKEKEEK